jgi:monothiol glutaredoxin
MERPVFSGERVHPAIREKIAKNQREIIDEVQEAIRSNDVVVVGMAQNPWPRKARKLLKGKQVPFCYLEYGSYLSTWRRRNALKMWTGWPTFPMIFVKGTFVGGYQDLERLSQSGELDKLLA